MIIVKVYGGLGNQIFQFIFGKYLEQISKHDVYFDFFYFEKNSYRKPSLLQCVTEDKLKVLKDDNLHLKFNRFDSFYINRIFNKIKHNNIYFDENKVFDINTFSSKNIYYFDGYWQNNIYFLNISQNIESFFNRSVIIPNLIQEIAIHVRRGDYLNYPNNKIWHVQNVNYYSTAINYLLAKYSRQFSFSRITIFTDDTLWVKENFNFGLKVEIISNQDFIDLFQLSNYQFLITSNSTFSITAALINSNKLKTVIVPKTWYLDDQANSQIIDQLYLKEWIKI